MALVCFVDVHIEVYVCYEWWSQDKKLGRLGQERSVFLPPLHIQLIYSLLEGPFHTQLLMLKKSCHLTPRGSKRGFGV